MTKRKLILIMGFPGSGKSTKTKELVKEGYKNINRDMYDEPGKVCSSKDFHSVHLDKLMSEGVWDIVVDNTYPTVEARKLAVDLAKKYKYNIECWEMSTTIEETEFNVSRRMIQRYGRLIPKDFSDQSKTDSNIFGSSVLFAYQKKYEKPTKEEGFSKIVKVKYVRDLGPEYKNKAIFVDYDGTLRETISGGVAPNDPKDVKVMPNRKQVLEKYKKMGYHIIGVSNQAGIARGYATKEQVISCFDETHRQLGMTLEYRFCEHNVPINCYCRKPMPGYGVEFIEKYNLDPSQCIMVGDMTSDKTFAKRCGFKYIDQAEFFKL